MKATVQDRYGSADVLALRDTAAPVAGDNHVLVGCTRPGAARTSGT